ncbi:unnamed protein product [Phaeothamnion confervicola]
MIDGASATPAQVAHVEKVRERLENIFRRSWKDASLLVFGSSGSGLATPSSDIDFSLILPAERARAKEADEKLRAANAVL